jgi:hypothetical protein
VSLPSVPVSVVQSVIPITAVLIIVAEITWLIDLLTAGEPAREASGVPGDDPPDRPEPDGQEQGEHQRGVECQADRRIAQPDGNTTPLEACLEHREYHACRPDRQPCQPESPNSRLPSFAKQLERPPAGARIVTCTHS